MSARLQSVLGAPAHTFSWDEAVIGDGIPAGIVDGFGVFVVRAGQQVVYLGRTKVMRRRLGEWIGAACGGDWPHADGFRAFDRWNELVRSQLVFEVFPGWHTYALGPDAAAAIRARPEPDRRTGSRG